MRSFRNLIRPVMCALLIASAASAEPFTVGVSAPLTGELAQYGEAVRNGFSLSSAEHPDSSLRFIYEDNRYDAKESVATFRTLVGEKHVNLVYLWGEAPLHAVAPLADRQGVPVVAMSVDDSPARAKRSIVVAVNPPKDFVATIRKHLRAKGLKKISLIATEDPFLIALIDQFKATSDADESVEVVATVSSGERDFRALATKLSRSNSDALGVYLLSGQVQTFYRELEKLSFNKPTFGTDVFESREEIRAAGRAMEGAMYPNVDVPAAFQQRYIDRYRSDAQLSYAYNAYLVGQWLHSTFGHQAALTQGSISSEEVISKVTTGPVPPPMVRSIEPGEVLHLSLPLVVKRVAGGGFEAVSGH